MTKFRGRRLAAPAFLRHGSLSEHFEAFAEALRAEGYAALTIRGYSDSIAHFAEWARRSGLAVSELSDDAVARFARHWCRCPGSRRWDRVSARYARRAGRFVRFLQQQGVLPPGPALVRPSLPGFRDWLVLHRGAAPRTVERYEGLLLRLPLPSVDHVACWTAADVRQFVLQQAHRHDGAQTRCIVTALRAYLRFLVSTGQCTPGIDHAVPTIPQWRLSALPRYLPPGDVERLIASCDPNTAVGLRDRAMLLLLARLGLRGGDLVTLRLRDIDWSRAAVAVCGKGRREVRLPLPQDAGNAILAYLKKGRPRVPIEQVFLCVGAPHRPLQNSGAVSSVVAAALKRAGIANPPSRGANLLRHSAATTLLRAGATLDMVSSVLRHRSLDMTAHYAKVDTAMLAAIAQPWPEGAPC